MSNLNGGLSGSGTLRGTLGGGGVPAQDVYWDDILNKPNFATVATSGSYNDLINKPNLANVATSGSYNDLTDKPTIPAAQVNADWNATSGVAEILNKPTIPAAQVNADWNATSGVAEILNKPTIPPAQVNADWNATSGVAEILNKPTIPTTASQIDYDNTTSGLQADDVQGAITELKSNLTDLEWIHVGTGTLSNPLVVNQTFKEAKFYVRAAHGNNYEVIASGEFTKDLDQFFVNNTMVVCCAGYYATSSAWGGMTVTITKTNNGYTFAPRAFDWAATNYGASASIEVYIR